MSKYIYLLLVIECFLAGMNSERIWPIGEELTISDRRKITPFDIEEKPAFNQIVAYYKDGKWLYSEVTAVLNTQYGVIFFREPGCAKGALVRKDELRKLK